MSEIRDLIKEIKKLKRERYLWSSKTIKAETRKLRSEWTTEMANDIAKFSSIDAESELRELLKKELGNEKLSRLFRW
jgi:hypothetical protein